MTMAKKFFLREDFDIRMFCAVFAGVYKLLYDCCDNGPDYEGKVDEGDRLLKDPTNAPLLKAYASVQYDVPTSDREVAAMAVTYGIFEKRYV